MQTFHEELNPKLWKNNKLKLEVSKKLKEIAEAFIESLEIPRDSIKDIVITGSSASYNYTPQSDIDLHLLVDFSKVHKDCPIVGEYLLSKKSEFNNNHDIYIYGIPVEVYAESIDNENVHNGLYSLKDNKWIDEPKKLRPVDNDIAVNAKFKEFKEAAENIGDKGVASEFIQKIKKMRKAGLEKAGEFSVENLVFKKLRNEGIIGKLMDIKKEGIDKELSLEEAYEDIISKIEEMCTTTGVMAPYPVGLAGETPAIKKENRHRNKRAMLGYSYQKSRNSKRALVETMKELADACEAIMNEGSSSEYFENKYGKGKSNDEDPGKRILQGQVKRVRNYKNKLTKKALEENPELAKFQGMAKNELFKLIGARKKGKLRGEAFRQAMIQAGKNINNFNPAYMSDSTYEKAKKAQEQINNYKKLAREVEDN